MIYAGQIDASGDQTIDTMRSKPRLILFTGTNRNTFDSVITTGQRGGFIGFAAEGNGGLGIVNYCQFAMMGGGLCSSQSANCAYAQSAAAAYGTNTLYQAQVVGLNGDGFTIHFSTGAGGGYKIFYLALTDLDEVYSFQHESNCDGDPRDEMVGFDPSLVLALGQWRSTCHALPKSTSTQPWTSFGIANLKGGASVANSEWIYQAYTKNVISQRWDNGVNQPGTTGIIGAQSKPFVFGSDLALGFLEVTIPVADTIRLNEVPGSGGSGFDYAIAVGGQECLRMDCGVLQAQFAEQTFTLSELADKPEGVIFVNMESGPQIQSNTPGRWGFGFATPSFECSWLIDLQQNAMYQTASHGWVSQVTPTAASYGDTDFTPPTGQIGFTTASLAAGGGRTGWGALKTFCFAPLLVSFSPANTGRPVGSQVTTRGGHITEGEGGGGRTVP